MDLDNDRAQVNPWARDKITVNDLTGSDVTR